jgi:hypothetical protein
MKADKLAFFEQVVGDLTYDGMIYRGSCPHCDRPTLQLKPESAGTFEPVCTAGCTGAQIRDGVRAVLHGRAGQNGTGRSPPAVTKKTAPLLIGPPTPQGVTAREIMGMTIDAARFAVPGYICEGLNILAGGQKLGKSWLALGLGVAIGSGGAALGEIPVQQGEVLYLCLEDGLRRLKDRLGLVLQGSPAPADLWFWPECAPASAGGIMLIEEWLKEHRRARLVMIDTLARFRGAKPPAGDIYQQDYDFGARLKRLADDYHVAIMLLHHLSKRQCEDPFDQVSGTIGVTASADATLLLKRQRGKDEAKLFVTGRDVEEREMALIWSKETCSWTLEGTAADAKRSAERREIIAWLTTHGRATPMLVAAGLEKNYHTTKALLAKMIESEELVRAGGEYWVPGTGG